MKGIKTFGKKGHQVAQQEMKQMQNCIMFKPILISDLSTVEKRQAMETLIVSTRKRGGRITARAYADESTQWDYTNCNKAASPTAITKSHLITAVVNTKQGRNVITANILNAFVQVDIKNNANNE